MLVVNSYGQPMTVHARIPRALKVARPEREKTRARYEYWRFAHEDGTLDQFTGVKRRFTVLQLSDLWGVTPQAVRQGIRRARSTKEALVGEILGAS